MMRRHWRKYLKIVVLIVLTILSLVTYMNRRKLEIIYTNTFGGRPNSYCEGVNCHSLARYFQLPISDVDKSCNKTCKRLWQPGSSAWFDSRFNNSISPVWSRRNEELSKDIKKWWLSIRNQGENISDVLDKVFKLIPEKQPLNHRQDECCIRCAVVGNSGNLRNSKYGKLIDSHHRVIRVNYGPTEGYEDDVGSKETHRLAYPVSFNNVKKGAHFVMVPFGINDINWLISALTDGKITWTYAPVYRYIDVDKSKVLLFNPALMYYAKQNWIGDKENWPSTGFMMLLFSFHICDEVNVFGFGASSYGGWDHYWEPDAGPWNFIYQLVSPHKHSFEENLLERLSEEGKIKIYRGVR
ncbi:CMP-N-acetylneuraminate-beta-galactosamide-alpha-2,3-sialyltransferase 2-like [Asterias rubens]|uniref:CMP-N-acetylneuraminate-beta-galactosamide- alpha-2,3-sialyltransferase 2-like n=1 Tax=Asterias rubens TaxID=7604 RepID=UPI001455329D|nr:CMP-N-acetylneuraminate-beta-galactosamide-alpha-2,3-sialyltransferase 2-like [Asterias rubens]